MAVSLTALTQAVPRSFSAKKVPQAGKRQGLKVARTLTVLENCP
jgi:hypothetical protein